MEPHELLLECLEELDSKEMDLFKWHLNQGINDFKIPKSQLENKQRFEVVGCMIQCYRRDDAGKLTLLILKKMKKMDLAEALRQKLGQTQQTKHTETGTAQKQEGCKPGQTQQTKHTETGTAQKEEGCKPGSEFVEKHRTELIGKVSLVEPIADDMKPLIGEEKYQIILKSGTRQTQMRTLLDFLTTPKMKDLFYQSLAKHERCLVEDLENSG